MTTLNTDPFLHDPSAKLDYVIDWSDWLGTTETISTSTWVTTSTGLTMSNGSIIEANKAALIWVEGASAGVKYVITNRIVTSEGRKDDRSLLIKGTER